MSKKPVAVVDNESSGKRIRVIRRFDTILEAETYVGALPDHKKVARGGYGIDAPEELINP